MNTIDIVLGIILLVAFYLGFKRGFILVLTSLLAVIAGAFCAIYFSGYAQARLYDWFDWNGDTTRLVGFALTFIAVVLVVSLLGRLVTKLLNFAFLGGINKLLGGFVNVLKYAFIVSLIFMFINATNNLRILTEEDREESILYTPVAALAPALLPHILEQVDAAEDNYRK